MGTFILTWNPEQWRWNDMTEAAERTAHGNAYSGRWSTGNTRRIRPGDRVFLLKQGRLPRGIIAAGCVTSDSYLAPHWDQARAERGDQAWRVDVEFDRILDPSLVPPLSTDEFIGPLSEVYWAMAASGFSIAEAAAEQLESLWSKHVQSADGPKDHEVVEERLARNPNWQRDELMLALDLYFRHPPSTVSQEHPEVIALSDLLNALPIHSNRPDAEHFRNPNGVYMKLCNFLRFDPNYQGSGLTRGNRLEKEIWDQYASQRDLLAALAMAIRKGGASSDTRVPAHPELDEEDFPEGRILYRLHRARERNRELVKRAKAEAMLRQGHLACVICQFDFACKYGPLGAGFIECHHTLPLSELTDERPTRLADVALVCANCHRMLHRKRPWLSVQELACLLA